MQVKVRLRQTSSGVSELLDRYVRLDVTRDTRCADRFGLGKPSEPRGDLIAAVDTQMRAAVIAMLGEDAPHQKAHNGSAEKRHENDIEDNHHAPSMRPTANRAVVVVSSERLAWVARPIATAIQTYV